MILFTIYDIMPNRDGTGPQGRGSMSGKGMGSCSGGKNVEFGRGQGKRCGTGARRGLGNRRTSLEPSDQNTNDREE